ncbi:chloride channel CLIC-like protein 1 [Diretmus argenteus]
MLSCSARMRLFTLVVCSLSLSLAAMGQDQHEDDGDDNYDASTKPMRKIAEMLLCVMVIVIIICTELWSVVSWFVQFKRLFIICFFISVVWTWFCLYKIKLAEHQNNMVKMEVFKEQCTGMKEIGWIEAGYEWFRSWFTLQDDPCQKYYETLLDSILLVTPLKAISVTITTFFTEPLKYIGQGISEFLRALLKVLPVTLQIPVFLTIVLSILVFIYVVVQAAFQHGITALLPRGRRGFIVTQFQYSLIDFYRVDNNILIKIYIIH